MRSVSEAVAIELCSDRLDHDADWDPVVTAAGTNLITAVAESAEITQRTETRTVHQFYFSKAMLSTTTVPFSMMHLSQCTPIVTEVNFFRTSRLRSSGIAQAGWLKESSLSL